MEKSIEELEKELQDLRESNKAAWDTYGSELCAGDMIGKEKVLEREIKRRKGIIDEYPVQFLRLADDLFPALQNGEKKLTVRKGRRDIKLGRLNFIATNNDELQKEVEVVEVKYVRISGVSDEICQQDGFKNWVDFYQGMKKYYPDLDVSEECTIIIFE